MKLWIISELFPPEETSTAYIMGEIAKAFSSKYDIGVICGPEIYDKSRKQFETTADGANHIEFTIYRAKVKTHDKNSLIERLKSFLSTSLSLYKLAKKNIKKGDKVLLVTNPAPLVLLMSRLRKSRDFELNVLVHDVFPENTKAAGINIPGYELIKNIFDRAFSYADRLIVLGRDMAKVMERKTKQNVPISIIENWGEFNAIQPIAFPDGNRIILEYAGNIGRVQGLEHIIESLPEDIDFHIYGSGAVENNLKRMGTPNVYFHGPYGRNEQSKILGACHINLVTLNKEMYGLGVPSKTYNILAAGRPILYFGPKDSEIDLLVRENQIGYCGWPEEWDIEVLKEMGIKAREIGEKRYSKNVIINKFLEII